MNITKANQILGRHQWIIEAQAEGLSHADSLLQLPFRGNCFNWILGHVLVHRDIMLELLNMEPLLSADDRSIYEIESSPLTPDSEAVDFGRLLELSRRSSKKLKEALATVHEDILDAIYNEERGITIGDRIEFLIWALIPDPIQAVVCLPPQPSNVHCTGLQVASPPALCQLTLGTTAPPLNTTKVHI